MDFVLTLATALIAFATLLVVLWSARRDLLKDQPRFRFGSRVGWTNDGSFATARITNISRLPLGIASIDILLRDGNERRVFHSFDEEGVVIGPMEMRSYPHDLRAPYGHRDVRGFRVRTECGIVKEIILVERPAPTRLARLRQRLARLRRRP